ncbi:ABC transporter substrate-binding protein [Mycoplasma sp. P36-A1]|uniref:ABC transporter substrate-binding protein n=1 Tax=Mycoplasma sp. P36-A1 TaxID=3252900 RepID=UPI003C2F9EA7
MKIIKRITVIVLLVLLSACSNQGNTNNPNDLTISNYDSNKNKQDQTFTKVPEKVLVVYQNSIETMLALGLEDHIVAAAGLDHKVKDEYATAFKKVNYLQDFTPDEESVIALKPDMIISWSSYFNEKTLGDVNKWHEKGINTFIASNTAQSKRTLENEYSDILNIGKIFKVEEKAQKIVDEMKNKVTEVKEKTKNSPKKKVLVIEYINNEATVYGKDSLVGDMVTNLNGEIIDANGKSIDAEAILTLNPDVIFTVYMDRDNQDMSKQSIKTITANKQLAKLDAVKNNKVFAIALGESYCSGIRNIDGLNILNKGMHE